jgi:hypothetical protein
MGELAPVLRSREKGQDRRGREWIGMERNEPKRSGAKRSGWDGSGQKRKGKPCSLLRGVSRAN